VSRGTQPEAVETWKVANNSVCNMQVSLPYGHAVLISNALIVSKHNLFFLFKESTTNGTSHLHAGQINYDQAHTRCTIKTRNSYTINTYNYSDKTNA